MVINIQYGITLWHVHYHDDHQVSPSLISLAPVLLTWALVILLLLPINCHDICPHDIS